MKFNIVLVLNCLLVLSFFSSCKDNSLPETFLIDPLILSSNSHKIKKGDKELQNILSEVIAVADRTMDKGPYSVTYKHKTPPSGDKRDYMSVGPYWWPDSTKFDGLPYIWKDGVVNPERYEIKDAEFFIAVCHDILLLSVAGYFTNRTQYAEKAVELMRVWFLDENTRMNPNLNYGQSIPGITEGRGIGLIDTRTLVNLIDGIQILKATNNISSEDYEGIQLWFRMFLDWMMTSPIGLDEARQHNNHGTYYDVQTVSIALFTNQKELAVKILENTTKDRIESHFAVDGSQPHELTRTLSWNYSVMNLLGFFELALLAENVDIDLWNYTTVEGKSLKKAFLWLLPYAEGKTWEYEQLKPIEMTNLQKISKIAARKYPDIKISYDTIKIKNDYLFALVH